MHFGRQVQLRTSGGRFPTRTAKPPGWISIIGAFHIHFLFLQYLEPVHVFEPYTIQHLAPVVFFALAGVQTVRQGRHASPERQKVGGLLLALTVLAFIAVGTLIKWLNGTFDITEDLPLHLCRLVAWGLPFVIWWRNRFWLGILYFWVLAGTLQGIVTPDLEEGFPDYFYFRYWFLHAGLVVTIIYAVIVFRVQITWKDFWRAVGMTQIYLVLVHGMNFLLGSNYGYTMAKPPGNSILDLLGPWPWYLLTGQLLMVALFLLLMLPWLRKRTRRVDM